MMSDQVFNKTPQSERVHIALFGRRNAGKSSLINALTGQQVALVSDVPGTTTDPVSKAMEILPIGPCVIIDTAGFDDVGKVGKLRIERTRQVIKQADIAIVVVAETGNLDMEISWTRMLKQANVPYLSVLNKVDLMSEAPSPTLLNGIAKRLGCDVIPISALHGSGINLVRTTMAGLLPDSGDQSLTGNLARSGDTVMLVMPQDPQAPKGRLILPQVQTLRDLMDKRCTAICCTTEDIDRTLAALKEPPRLIITDSQVFDIVEKQKPESSLLTSFSVLMAAHKGDIRFFARSAMAIDRLTEQSRVLIAEACTHAPLAEDIGRVKIPRILRQRVGEGLQVDIVAGKDFPEDVTAYDLVIHCGGCMFNSKFMLSRVMQCRRQGTPMTNYGIAIAHIKGILGKVSIPE